MKVLKSTILKKRKCKFGNFELRPEAGWKISQSFIDFESGLLIVSESDENEDNWVDTGFGSRRIPNREYRIDVKTCEILSSEQWKKRFSYKTVEQISEDGKYKLITTRVHEPERDSDSIKEELIEIASGKIISSNGVAFREDKRENLLEAHYREIEEIKERKARLDALPTLKELLILEFDRLENGDVIIEYYNSEFVFKLIYTDSVFELLKTPTSYRYDLDFDSLNYSLETRFSLIQDFASEFLTDKIWFLNHTCFNSKRNDSKPNQLLKKFVVEFFNELRRNHDFSFDEYNKIRQWENHFYEHESVKPKEYKQFCSNCKSLVSYFPRYPKYICSNCSAKEITDESGLELSFSNIGMSGGFRVVYKKNGEIIKEDTSQREKLCFIEGKRFIATEARFGGIVIQTEE